MTFFRRLLSSDFRAAVAAEAAGKFDQAAERYALAGDRAAAVRMHLLRAERTESATAAIPILRDALHWAGSDPTLRKAVGAPLGAALLLRAQAEGVATARDHERVREAASFLLEGEQYARAGDALTLIGDHAGAAAAYSAGGIVDRLEQALTAADAGEQGARDLSEAFTNYQTALHVGRRDDARAALVRCLALAPNSGDYRRLLDEFDAALITAGRCTLASRGQPSLLVCALPVIAIGRDPLCDVPLRTGGISRHHAEIEVASSPTAMDDVPVFFLRDAGSRNGTLLGGVAIAGMMPLADSGNIGLGDDCRIEFVVRAAPPRLLLTVATGVDRGLRIVVMRATERSSLADLGWPVEFGFVRGRPVIVGASRNDKQPVVECNGVALGEVVFQLIRGDRLRCGEHEVEIE